MDGLLSSTALSPIDGFALHKINRVSPSSLYIWTVQPSLWLVERLLNLKVPVGCAAHRGSAAEAGIALGLMDPDLSVRECQEHALKEYDRLTALSADPRRVKEREGIPGMVEIGLAELRQYGKPSGMQGMVEHRFDGLSVPIMGYYDFLFADHGVLVDLKTTLRLPSESSIQHCRQCALYVHGTNTEARLAYTTPQKIGVYRVENPAQHVRDLENIARRLNKFLSLSPDPMELASLLTPDLDHFLWNNPIARNHAKTVFGL